MCPSLATLRIDYSSNCSQDFLEYSGDVQFGYRHEILNRADEENQLQQARLNYDIGRTNLDWLKLSLEARTTNAFYDLVQGVRQLDIQKQRLEQSTAALYLAKRKFEIGLIAEVQALRLEVEKLRSEATYAQAATSIESQRDALRRVLGMEMSAPLEISTDVGSTFERNLVSARIDVQLPRSMAPTNAAYCDRPKSASNRAASPKNAYASKSSICNHGHYGQCRRRRASRVPPSAWTRFPALRPVSPGASAPSHGGLTDLHQIS